MSGCKHCVPPKTDIHREIDKRKKAEYYVYISPEGELRIEAYKQNTTVEICVEIQYCPMCGRDLKEEV